MNIVYLNHYAGSPAHGMEYRPYYLAREWVRQGHRVCIVAASFSHVRQQQPELAGRPWRHETVDGIDYLWLAAPRYHGNGVGRVRNIFTFLYRLWRHEAALPFAPDAVIASSTYPLDIHPARRLARRHRAVLAWEVHDLWPLSPIELGGMSPRHPFIRLLQHAEDRACREAGVVVSMLPMARAHLEAHGMAAAKFHYVPNGIAADEWEPARQAPLPEAAGRIVARARAAGRSLIAYAGAHGIANALDSLLDAAALCRDEPVSFLLVGDGPEKARLEARAQALQLADLHFLPPVPKAAIPALLGEMDALYIGLQREPLFRFGISPNKLIDYMMAGRPILCAIEAGNDPVGEAGCGLTLPAEDPPALAAGIRRLLALDPAERARMGRAGRRHAETHHLYPALATRFLGALAAARAA
ncbi:glycosyltransferase family 4 protein [Chitinimonas koreensis]|uniref:glycosyltransferase family 4 protein n=1 Tax=Chitinimonas koreensis TaxID=356302 RepID=UPI0003FADC83|nr:glycosyltransferase family 4 protein [Chitinimonas koreensis]QNM97367.1 glycosyltransferase family 4 protein [Chitinimonas koreensis]